MTGAVLRSLFAGEAFRHRKGPVSVIYVENASKNVLSPN